MPKLARDIGHSVFYLYRLNPKTGKWEGPCGTGFVVARRSARLGNFNHYYGVSNWHLTHDQGASIIRINTTDGKSRFLDYGPEDWEFVKDGDDLSIIDLTDKTRQGDQVSNFADHGFVDKNFIEQFQVSLGEDVFMLGLFAAHHGGERNTPVARFGNLALLADDAAPIEQPNGVMRPSHLVDMRSRTGFSGSPVALYRLPDADLSTVVAQPFVLQSGIKMRAIALLGVHCGQFPDPVKVYKSPPKREREGDPIHEGDTVYIQSGMTIVVPAWRIIEMLDLEVFEMARRDRENRLEDAARRRPQPESVPAPTTEASTDANPNHREGFTSLLHAAAKKPEPKEQT